MTLGRAVGGWALSAAVLGVEEEQGLGEEGCVAAAAARTSRG